jgi:hypothetical protein
MAEAVLVCVLAEGEDFFGPGTNELAQYTPCQAPESAPENISLGLFPNSALILNVQSQKRNCS